MKVKKIASLFTALVLSSSLALSACGSEDNASSGGDGGKAAAPADINISVISYADEFIDDTNSLWQEFEKKTNTKLNINWISATTFADKINVLLASGNLPDLTFVEDITAAPVGPQIRNMIKQGVFWDLTPFLNDYPNLSSPAMKETIEKTKIEGKNYTIPRYYPSYGGGVFPILRKDWLDKLGLKMPETVDEFYNTLKAFKEKDPDGNGIADTVAYAANPDFIGFMYNIFNDTQGAWKLRDGKLHSILTEDASKEAMLWIKKAYDDGLFPADFAILNFSQINDVFQSGKAGGGGYAMNNAWSRIEPIQKIDPKADLMPVTAIAGPSGNKYTPSGAPFYGHYLIPKKVPEDKVKKILAFMDYGYGEEGNKLARYGIPGVHYKEENGNIVPTEQAKKDKVTTNLMDSIFHEINEYSAVFAQGMPADFYARQKQIVDERKNVKVPRPDEGLVSDAYNKYYSEIKKKTADMRVKVILGKATLQEYDKYVADLKADPNMQLITKEMNETYQASLKK
ncbi:extracellular solute-binding protein [Paenibacillus alkaliterrae]|uniref:extracellular solute-binding protein n=1 Tax=Paenibacillus alkaliterrae TaxID=320909 RepID=UPI001F283A29|nr:extracellular solute-binding protein [Paenibacillus alkaliterrae]MCF2938653.1 extracellular solute-binding protein [Paenibacillus alkaliterrae]